MAYTNRKLSFESDRLNAIRGCLKLIQERKDMHFIEGLPSRDFHYALLWEGEYDRPKVDCPSWSWAGWHSFQQSYIIFPLKGSSGTLAHANDVFKHYAPAIQEIELQGLLISLTERPHRFNRCIQNLSTLRLDPSTLSVTITSEVATFRFDIVPQPPEDEESYQSKGLDTIPKSFDSRIEANRTWSMETEYSTPYNRLLMRDDSGNTYKHHYPYWFDHSPYFKI